MAKSNNSSNNIGYTGKVSVSVVGTKNKLNKQYKVKNKGYEPLFKYISTCLAGNVDLGLCPNYIATYDGNEEEFAVATCTCSKPMSKSSAIVTSNNTTELTFTIPGTFITSGSTINLLALYCDDYYTTYREGTRKPSAIVELDQNDSIRIESSESLVVVWEFKVENQLGE